MADEGPKLEMPPLSKMLPMVIMIGLSKFDLDALGLRQHCEALFVGVQVGCLCTLMMMKKKIDEKPNDPAVPKIKIPAEMVMGQVAKPAKELTAQEYDTEQFGQLRTQTLMGAFILGIIYYNWKSLLPLVLQAVLTPVNLYEHPLFQIYLLNRDVKRPFPKPNPFGLPEAPPAADNNPATGTIVATTAGAIDDSQGGLPFIRAEFGGLSDEAGEICLADPLPADRELVNKSSMQGKVAVVVRGVVPFVEKARRAAEAGAVALIVINNEDSLYQCTAAGAECDDIKIPVVCVSSKHGEHLNNGKSVSVCGVSKGAGKVLLDGQHDVISQSSSTEGLTRTAAGKKKSE